MEDENFFFGQQNLLTSIMHEFFSDFDIIIFFQRADLTAIETMTEYEEQNKTIIDLQERLVDAEFQIVEAEKLRKKLHNTILVLVLICLT